MKKIIILSICFLQSSLFLVAQNTTPCSEDLSEVVSSMKLHEGENIVCSAEDDAVYVAIVKAGKVIDWKIKDATGKQIAYKILDNNGSEPPRGNDRRAAKGKRTASTSISAKIPVKIIICTIVNGKVTTNCRTVIKT